MSKPDSEFKAVTDIWLSEIEGLSFSDDILKIGPPTGIKNSYWLQIHTTYTRVFKAIENHLTAEDSSCIEGAYRCVLEEFHKACNDSNCFAFWEMKLEFESE
jgi:hypothetical protein